MKVIVIGGGILGLATAHVLTGARAEAEVVVLEKESAPARHQSGRNSGVVHAGLYYPPGSLKARLCRRGMELLREFCHSHAIAYEECGKLVAATEPHELEPLRRLADRAQANEVPGLRWLDASESAAIEPELRTLAALHSPRTAIVDYREVAQALADEVVTSGGAFFTSTTVTRVRAGIAEATVELADGSSLTADRVIVCAGLQADRLARASGQAAAPAIVPFRGEYWQLRPERTGLVRGLIYPVPDPTLPFLGVHLTRRIDGSVWLGPNAVLSLAREGYASRARLVPRDAVDALTWPGTRRMVRRHWRAGLGELHRCASKRAFIAQLRRYVPSLTPDDAVRAPAGIRAQALDPDGTLVDDFRLTVTGPVVWVRNAPSPAATSSLAIAEELVGRARI